MTNITLDKLKRIPLHYEEGHDDPQADIRYRNGPIEQTAGDMFTNDQLNYVISQLEPKDKPIEFYVSRIWLGSCRSLEIALISEQKGKKMQKELYFSRNQIEPKKAKLYWNMGLGLRLTLEDYHNRWKNDPWR
jgi:hypothetical protein